MNNNKQTAELLKGIENIISEMGAEAPQTILTYLEAELAAQSQPSGNEPVLRWVKDRLPTHCGSHYLCKVKNLVTGLEESRIIYLTNTVWEHTDIYKVLAWLEELTPGERLYTQSEVDALIKDAKGEAWDAAVLRIIYQNSDADYTTWRGDIPPDKDTYINQPK